jgi:diguanylate cyclase (GGDEF)-like protein
VRTYTTLTDVAREIFTESLEEARKVFNADSGLIYSVNRQTGKLSIVGSFGYDEEILEKMKEKGVGDLKSCLACQRMDTVKVDNLATEEKCPNLAKVAEGSCICLPITGADKLWGVLHLRRKHADAFTPESIALAQAMNYQFGLAMQRASLFDQVNFLAITDPHTGLFNYRKLDRDMKREFIRSLRYDHQFSFIMADIDHFKEFNDLHGHQAGDSVLRWVARAMEDGRREVDRVYRYGGEEFSVMLPETGWPEALEVAEKIRQSVASAEVSLEGSEVPLGVTISMGVAAYPHDGMNMGDLVKAADEALYVAKQSGRNIVVAYSDLADKPHKRAHPDLAPGR